MNKKAAKNRKKMFSLLAVAMMMLMAFAMAMPAEESDADATSYYRYEMTYSGEQITQIDIYTSSTAASPAKTITTKNAVDSFWTFTDGYGPFNSCYAAVDSNGAIAFYLNPNNLKQKLDGTSYTTSNYNIVWLVPTVYWNATSAKLTMCSESFSGASAYAHTIGGSVHKYIGIGVYEASKSTFGGVSNCLMSQTGKTPTVSTTIVDFDTYAHNTPGNTMLWNFYQWTLTKMATYTVGMGKNSQQIFGAGLTNGSAAATTGLGDSAGAIVTGQTSYSKVFIENSWGSVYEWVGDTVFSERKLYAGQNASGVTYIATTGKTAGSTLPSSGWIGGTSKNAMDWDLPTSKASSSNASDTSYPGDYVYSITGTRMLNVGGNWSSGTFAGVASASAYDVSGNSYSYIGARLAYYFDAVPAPSNTVTFDSNGGSNSPTAQTVSTGSSISLPSPGTKVNYTFDGWCITNTSGTNVGKAGASYTPTGNVTLVAKWTANYVVTYNYQGGSGGPTSDTVSQNGSSITLPTPSRSHYTFDKWYTQANGKGTQIGEAGGSYTPTQSITIHANWILAEYVITMIDSDDDTQISTAKTISKGAQLDYTPSKSGYRFNGWFDSASGGNRLDSSSAVGKYTPTGDTVEITIYAQWTQYYITVNHSILTTSPFNESLNSALSNLNTIASYGDNVVLTDLGYQQITRDSKTYLYKHTGWHTSAVDTDNPAYSKTASIPNATAQGMTVYSTWDPVIVITAPSNIGDVTYSNSSFGSTGGIYYLLDNQVKWPSMGSTTSGYTHVGFTLDTDNSYYSSNDTIPAITRSGIAIASFVQPSVTVKFWSSSDNHLIATLAVPSGSSCLLFSPNLSDVYAFTGWYWDSACTEKFDPSTVLTTSHAKYDNTNNCFNLWASAVEFLQFTSNPVTNGTIYYSSDYAAFLFDSTDSENAAKVLWDFGDGSTSTDRIVYHAYTSPGKYNVSLTTSNYYGEESTKEYAVYWQVSEESDGLNVWFIVAVALAIIVGLMIVRRLV